MKIKLNRKAIIERGQDMKKDVFKGGVTLFFFKKVYKMSEPAPSYVKRKIISIHLVSPTLGRFFLLLGNDSGLFSALNRKKMLENNFVPLEYPLGKINIQECT